MPDPPAFLHGLPADVGPLLDLLSQSWPEPERSLQRQVLASALASSSRDSFICLRATQRDALLGAVLAQTLPGRTAAVYPPQTIVAAAPNLRERLIASLEDSLRAVGIELAQSLLSLDQTEDEARLAACGFTTAAALLYMACEPREHGMPAAAADLVFEPVTASSECRLRETLEATYEGTLDCPLLNGIRTTADVLAGYRAVGTCRPELWLLARHGQEDVGCLILADHPEAGNLELVYLGIVPAARGRGYGRALAAHALRLAADALRARVVLAVDAANRPAIGHYEATGFIAFDQRLVMIKRL